MAIITINANPSAYAAQPSAYGAATWNLYAGPQVGASIAAGNGTGWMVWAFGATGITPGETVNAVSVSGVNDFTVGGGGAGRVRTATLYGRALNSFTFTNAAGTSLDTYVGTGTGKSLNASFAPAGSLTTTDLLNGTCFVGVAVATNTGDPTLGNGDFRYNAFSFTFYTGADGATPPPTTTVTTLSNPIGNTTPGVKPGGQFAALGWTFVQPKPQTLIRVSFGVPINSGLTFAGSGNYQHTITKGTSGDPANPYAGTTTAINCAASTKPGTYLITTSTDTGGAASAQLIVKARPSGFFFEV
jgi:hypothetical protein